MGPANWNNHHLITWAKGSLKPYLIFVTDTTDSVCVKFSVRCKFFQIEWGKKCIYLTFSETFLVFLVPLVDFLGVKFGFRKSCLCKRNDKYEV